MVTTTHTDQPDRVRITGTDISACCQCPFICVYRFPLQTDDGVGSAVTDTAVTNHRQDDIGIDLLVTGTTINFQLLGESIGHTALDDFLLDVKTRGAHSRLLVFFQLDDGTVCKESP